jgi:Ca-activated chloride channel homolog
MEFLNPTALYGLYALPLLLVPYFIRRKPRRVVFSSLLLFIEQQGSQATAKPWGRLRLPLLFFLQLLLLMLLILALAEPVFSVRLSNIAIVMDNSASMQAQEDGAARIELARDAARIVLADLGANGKVDIFQIVPRLEKVNKTKLSPSDAVGLLASLEPFDLADAAIDYGYLLNQLAEDQKYERVYFITDRPVRGQSGAIRVLTVGKPRDNLAVTAFTVFPSSLVNTPLEARVEVANYYGQDQRVRVTIRDDGGGALAQRELTVPAGRTAFASFQGFAERPYYLAEIDRRDALRLDNQQFAVPANTRSLKILGVSPRPQALNSLRAIAGVSVNIVAPDEYQQTDRSAFGLEIFHFSTPVTLPANPSVLVLPPDNNPAVRLGPPVARAAASGWRESHPLNRYLNFALFRPAYARPLIPQIAGDTIIESPQGALAFTTERQGKKHLVLGFDPFPYLGRENLPMSIFTLNFLDWFISASGAKDQATGELLVFGAAQQELSLNNPKGEKHVIKPGSNSFAETFYQGIYQLNRGGQRQLFAINYQAASESDLRERQPIDLRTNESATSSASAFFSFWPYLLMASLLLFIIEWFFVPSAPSVRVRAGAPRPKFS